MTVVESRSFQSKVSMSDNHRGRGGEAPYRTLLTVPESGRISRGASSVIPMTSTLYAGSVLDLLTDERVIDVVHPGVDADFVLVGQVSTGGVRGGTVAGPQRRP